jgi:uncharacterized protein
VSGLREAAMQMKQRDWLLLLLDGGMDPIRIQKGMFLFAMESGAPDSEVYQFEPYNWGPFSRTIYADLETLEAQGFIERVPVIGATYARYRRTADGEAAAARLSSKANPEHLDYLMDLRGKITKASFDRLLRAVYRQYPHYATRSMLNQ